MSTSGTSNGNSAAHLLLLILLLLQRRPPLQLPQPLPPLLPLLRQRLPPHQLLPLPSLPSRLLPFQPRVMWQ